MLSKKLYFIFGTCAIIIAVVVVLLPRYYNWISIWMVPFVLALALSYVFSPQIDWWWFQRHPPELPGRMANLLLEHFDFYKNLSVGSKKRFRHRTAMYIEARGFSARRGGEDEAVPLDIKTVLAANMVMMTFGRKDFILDKFERIFLYLQAFHSPNHPYWHASEVNEEDECFLFSGEHILLAFRQPDKFFNVVLYEFGKAFRLSYPQLDYPAVDESLWDILDKKAVAKFTGMPEEELDLWGICVYLFFYHPAKLKGTFPVVYERCVSIFNLQPMEVRDPVVDHTVIENIP